jgi:hypothetical protein
VHGAWLKHLGSVFFEHTFNNNPLLDLACSMTVSSAAETKRHIFFCALQMLLLLLLLRSWINKMNVKK